MKINRKAAAAIGAMVMVAALGAGVYRWSHRFQNVPKGYAEFSLGAPIDIAEKFGMKIQGGGTKYPEYYKVFSWRGADAFFDGVPVKDQSADFQFFKRAFGGY